MALLDARTAADQPGRGPMQVQLVNCFVSAAAEVLASETGDAVERHGIQLQQDPYTSEEVTAMIGVSGQLAGSFYLSMSEATALALVSKMLGGQEILAFDDLAQSGIAELANVVAGTAGVGLADMNFTTNITPPLLLVGAGARLSTVEIQRIVVPLETTCGPIRVHVALRESV